MAQVRVRAVANVMGLRRGDIGDVETGSVHVDAMINAGYLEVLEYMEDPEPRVAVVISGPVAEFLNSTAPAVEIDRGAAKQFAQPNSFGDAEVVDLPDEVEVSDGKPRKARSRPSRARSAAKRGPAGDAGDGQDAREGVSDGSSGHGPDAGGAPDGEAVQPT